MSIKNNLLSLKETIPNEVCLVAVSKTKPNHLILEAYENGQIVFGENKVQELVDKYTSLPKNIEWHMIGHRQTNKVKYIAPFITLIHSVDSIKLLKEIDKKAIIKKDKNTIPKDLILDFKPNTCLVEIINPAKIQNCVRKIIGIIMLGVTAKNLSKPGA